MSAITTHVLDLARGCPAADVAITLEHESAGAWNSIGWGRTDPDGRLRALLPEGSPLIAGTYRLTFHTREYFEAGNVPAFYPVVMVTFVVQPGEDHYHVPLLLSPFGYTTYRGT
jgi:5-hydroxyisourate hydrolase